VKCRVFGAPEQRGHDGHGIHSRGCTTDAVFGFAGSDGGEGTDAGGSAELLGINVPTFQRWAERYEAEGDDGLVRLLKGRDCLGRKCGLRSGVPKAPQQIKIYFPTSLFVQCLLAI
jgi:hypothetical protein